MDDTFLSSIFIVGIIALVPIIISTTAIIANMKLKVEKIRADALVRAEEVKARNQLEIEKLICEQQADKVHNSNLYGRRENVYTQSDEDRRVREKRSNGI